TTAIAGLSAPTNGDRAEIVASQLEVAVLDRTREHRTFRRLTGGRLESLLAEAAKATAPAPASPDEPTAGQAGSGEPDAKAKPKRASNGQKPAEPETGAGESNGGSKG
ncbi:MAG TPA: hypothetical protein VN695_20190, partial [Streptosporangiaceae bacterium]|nr:hypothetical protein [Streptosporangiaceae bacterium]